MFSGFKSPPERNIVHQNHFTLVENNRAAGTITNGFRQTSKLSNKGAGFDSSYRPQ